VRPMPGQDITEEYDTAKEYVREKFEENPDLAESDTKLVFEMIKDALGIELPFDHADMPSVGTITRASRELRNEEGYNELVSDETQEQREEAEEDMTEHMGDTSQEDDRIIWG